MALNTLMAVVEKKGDQASVVGGNGPPDFCTRVTSVDLRIAEVTTNLLSLIFTNELY